MYDPLMTNFELIFKGPPEQLEDSELLKALSRKEVERFNEYVMSEDPWFRDGGLSKSETMAIAGYIYQKAKGHVDAFHKDSSGDMEGQDGPQAGS